MLDVLLDIVLASLANADKRAPVPAIPDPSKGLLIRMNLEGWRSLRILAAETDTTLNALAIEAFNDLLKKHGKKQTVENPLAD
jgi:hypothetical protein